MSHVRSQYIVICLFLFSTMLLLGKSEYTYSYMPKKVYAHSVFSVTIIGPDDQPSFIFDTSSPIQPLFDKPLIVKNGKDAFYTFYFKANRMHLVVLPMLFIRSDFEHSSLSEHSIAVEVLNGDSLYSSVMATDMKIVGQQVSNYDGENHMVTLSLEAYEANLEDMKLQNVKEYGIEDLKRHYAKVTAEFYAVLPREQKTLEFSYFNTIKKHFITLNVPVEVANASVTTQSDLNPKVDAFERLKLYAVIAFLVFFMIMFLWKRDFFYLILAVITLITLLTFYMPHKKICIQQGAPLYILPTSTSTIGTRIDIKRESIVLGERNNYKKIEYKKGVIGWIKDEDVCNN